MATPDTSNSKNTVASSNYANGLQHATAIIHVAMRGAQELTHLVAEVHSTITALPSPFNKHHQPSAVVVLSVVRQNSSSCWKSFVLLTHR